MTVPYLIDPFREKRVRKWQKSWNTGSVLHSACIRSCGLWLNLYGLNMVRPGSYKPLY